MQPYIPLQAALRRACILLRGLALCYQLFPEFYQHRLLLLLLYWHRAHLVSKTNQSRLVTKRARIWLVRGPRRGIWGAQLMGIWEERTLDRVSQSIKLYIQNRYYRTYLQVRLQLEALKGPNNRSQELGAKKGHNNNKGIYRQELSI